MAKARPRFMAPMLARLSDRMPAPEDWYYEVKVDGIRAVAVKEGGKTRLYSRKPRELGANYPAIVAALNELKERDLVLDGEIVVLDSEGRSSFQMLQNLSQDRGVPVFYILFDVLHIAGSDIWERPLEFRRGVLERIVPRNDSSLRLSPIVKGRPDKIWREVRRLGLEGIIAKRKEGSYESGRRSGGWLKVKSTRQQEFVIGGYTEPGGTRPFFGAILVGYQEGKKFQFASAVGTGFTEKSLAALHELFQGLRTPRCPFANLPAVRKGRWGKGLTAAEMSRCTWLKPQLVCEVKFHEWTRDGNLRHPVFLGLRNDKKPREVRREDRGSG